MNAKRLYIILRETTLPTLLVEATLGRRPCVVALDPLFPRMAGLLERLVRRLRAADRITTIEDDHPERKPFSDVTDLRRQTNIFAESEPWIETHFGFKTAERRFGLYGEPYKDLCCIFLYYSYYTTLYQLRALSTDDGERPRRIIGCSPTLRAFHRARFGEEPDPAIVSTSHDWRWLFNPVFTLIGLGAAMLAALLRIRPHVTRGDPVFLGHDHDNDWRDRILWDELDDASGEILPVFRNRASLIAHGADVAPRNAVWVGDGRLTPCAGLGALWRGITDVARIAWWGRDLPPPLFFALVALPRKRVLWRALIARFRFRNFFGRDDYNADHFLRTAELRRAGGTSIGMMHGVHGIFPIGEPVRHLDFDRYYVLGIDPYDRFYRTTWPSSMAVKAIGSFGLSRDDFHRMTTEPHPGDVACFIEASCVNDATIEAIKTVAQAFPEKRIYVATKKKYLDGPFGDQLRTWLGDEPRNIEIYDGNSYDLLFRVSYLVFRGIDPGRRGCAVRPLRLYRRSSRGTATEGLVLPRFPGYLRGVGRRGGGNASPESRPAPGIIRARPTAP